MNFLQLFTGLYLGYPICCIKAFARGCTADKHKVDSNDIDKYNLDYIRCYSCISNGNMDLRPARREEYYEIAQGYHNRKGRGYNLRECKRERE